MSDAPTDICEIALADRAWVRAFLEHQFGSTKVVTRGVTLHAAVAGRGLGSRLLAAARDRARDLQCRRLWLITTNDNEPAIAFYTHWGMRLAAVHRGAIAASRKLKPEISQVGVGGRPIEDEVEFELLL